MKWFSTKGSLMTYSIWKINIDRYYDSWCEDSISVVDEF